MFLWALLRNLPIKKTYGHCELVYEDPETGELLSTGAIAEGVRTTDFIHVATAKKVIDLKEFEITLTYSQYRKFHEYLRKTNGKKYEFESFFWHFVKILTGKWFGSKSSKETVCFEYVLTGLKELGYDVNVFMNPYEVIDWLKNNSNE